MPSPRPRCVREVLVQAVSCCEAGPTRARKCPSALSLAQPSLMHTNHAHGMQLLHRGLCAPLL